MNTDNVDNSLVDHLKNRKLQPAIHKFEQTGHDSELRKEIDFSIEQIIAVIDTNTDATIEKLKSSLRFDSDLRKDNQGLLKAIEILESKTPDQ